ncbi:hypothetical protein A3860_21015 [Niastella vici]|uniref:Secretion system C-terminal sorting domain-containing protein n=1 Tax=Niastella vici TaxID=1703345 RepID=A0A1V9G1K2_9BACT|nr:T9SS type A sorting domain-containing protein [Niastella vici]OQP64452.1 hypothetical protein A3860_21015 [Niastella vici]
MKHLYPGVTKTGLPAIKRIVLLIAILIYSAVALAQSLNFNTPVLESGTAQQQGCVYRFSPITAGGNIDALVKVDSLIGVTLSDIDATPSGSSTTALQPQMQSLGGVGYHYAVFTITFVNHGTTTPTPVFDFSSVFMGLDGSNQMTEFNAITVSNASWQYVSPTPKVAVTQNGDMVWGTATSSDPTGGQGVDETDSTQMFKVSSPATSSVTMRVGYYQSSNGWKGNDLFSLNIRGSELAAIILPVNLLSFTAQLVNDKVWLAWSTSKEENMSHYSIERSYDNKTFDEAALLFTADNPLSVNNYSYKDPVKNVTGSVIYYRLKMVDKSGKYKYSEVRSVRLGNGTDSARIAVYPNPVVNELHISLPTDWQNKNLNGQLLSIAGNIIKTFNIQQSATIGMADVPAGTYYIKVVNGKEISTQTIVKSRN